MVSRLCISQWQHAWRIYFHLLQFLLFSVILQCFIIYVFWVLYLWLLRCDCCRNWQNVLLLYKWTVHTTKLSYPKMCFLLLTALCKLFFLFVFSFYFIFILVSQKNKQKKKKTIRIVTILLSFYIFSYLVAIKDFLIFEMFQRCCVCYLFVLLLPSISLTLEGNTWWLRSQIE